MSLRLLRLAASVAPLAALVALAAATVSTAGEPPAGPAPASGSGELAVSVPTALVPYPWPGEPPAQKDAEARASQPATTVELYPGAPAGFAVPAGVEAFQGTLDAGGRKTSVAALRGDGETLTVLVDGDRDGKLDASKDSKESYVARTTPKKPASASLDWRVDDVRLGDVSVRVLPSERAGSFAGALLLPPPTDGPGGRQTSRPLAFTFAKPVEVTKAPDLAGTIRYATAKAGDKTVYVAVARGEGEAIAIVASENPDLSAAARLEIEATPLLRTVRRIGTRWATTPAPMAGFDGVTVQVTELTRNLAAAFLPQGSRRGSADVGGQPHVLFLVDGDLDGKFSGAEDSWWFGPKGALNNANPNNMFEADAPCLLDGGLVFRLESVAADGTATVVRRSEPDAVGSSLARRAERVNARRWFPSFAADEASFAKAHKLDLARARASGPAPFRFTRTFAEAQALATREGKPLLVDFEADWCVWCKRLDFHTYVDAEVAKRLGRFTAVKMNNEIDPNKSCSGFGWSGIPAVAVFHADGKPVVFRTALGAKKVPTVVDHVSGWLKPEEFLEALDAALAAYDDVRAGKPPLEMPKRSPPPAKPSAPGAPAEPAMGDAPKAPGAPAAPTAPAPEPGTPAPPKEAPDTPK